MMRTIATALLVLLTGSSVATNFNATATSVQSVVHALEARYHRATTLKAIFFERYSDGNGAIAAESGTVYFSRPGRMRWEYESPQEKLFLVDGTNVWFYIPADHTASRAKLKESSDWRTPLALLTGKADLGRMCRSISFDDPASTPHPSPSDKPATPGDSVVRCIPRDAATDPDSGGVREILFETDAEAHLMRVVIRQPGNLETEFRFGNWEENLTIPEIKFHFKPPAGVAIVDESKLADQIQ
jgi:outer membrane lipoprotein carrier protein